MKDKEEIIEYRLKTAEKDFITAEHLIESGDYYFCLFVCHLVLEKGLKSLYVKNIDINAPYKHSLPFLAQKINLQLTSDQEDFLEEVSTFNMDTRYPDVKLKFYKKCTKEYTREYFDKTKEFFEWLKILILSNR